MEWRDYSEQAMRFAVHNRGWQEQLENAAYGLIGETGEIVDLLKKHRWHGHDLAKDKIIEECSDCYWYCALGLHQMRRNYPIHFYAEYKYSPKTIYRLVKEVGKFAESFPPQKCYTVARVRRIENIVHLLGCVLAVIDTRPETTLQFNIDKLTVRYPQGFTIQDSLHRADVV